MQAPAQNEVLVNYIVYGDRLPNAAAQNHIGKVYAQFDQSGMVVNEVFDFKGQLRHQRKQFTLEYKQTVNWADLAAIALPADILNAAANRLSAESFQVYSDFDALGRPTRIQTPDQSEVLPGYNAAGFLESLDVKVRGAALPDNFVQNIDYDAKGQRTTILYGNGVQTTYAYEPETFRLQRLRSTRNAG
ncbi:MAG: toxin, partial [Chloroflexota bacterium]